MRLFTPIRDSTGPTSLLSRVQDAIAAVLNPLAALELLDGRLISGVALSGTAVNVAHGLGRSWRGVAVVKQSADARVWQPTDSTPGSFVTLQASAAVTVSLWVF